jgi:DNA-directed RNA polymerase specialized sigma24 family protein
VLTAAPDRRSSSRKRRGPRIAAVPAATADRNARPATRATSLRSRLAAALERCGRHERLAMALVLVERLTPAEAADVLGTSARGVDRTVHLTLARLRRVSRGSRVAESRLRKAS